MKIAIISDIHDNAHNLTLFFQSIKESEIEKIIFLGDFMNNGIAKLLATAPVPVHAIWGNNDGDRVAIVRTASKEKSNLEIGFDIFDFIEIDDRKIFLTHYPRLAKPMAKSGEYDAVFYGHDHIHNIDHINDCIIVNPGEISAHKTQTATYAIYDTETNAAEILSLKNIVSVKTDQSKKYIEKIDYDFSRSTKHEY